MTAYLLSLKVQNVIRFTSAPSVRRLDVAAGNSPVFASKASMYGVAWVKYMFTGNTLAGLAVKQCRMEVVPCPDEHNVS